jgi:transcriptional regulator with XRE-family HTH domain
MGRRLRALRLQAGLTQQELAVLMGRQGKGNHFVVGGLERGTFENPTLGLVADYLRACRASFMDIADLLEAYTSKPTVLEQRGYERVRSLADKLPPEVWDAVRRYDDRLARARLKPEPEDKRFDRAEAYARAQDGQHRLSELVAEELSRAGIQSASVTAFRLRPYARKLWGVLNKTRNAKPERRKLKLKQLENWAAESNLSALPALASIATRTIELFADMERKSELD